MNCMGELSVNILSATCEIVGRVRDLVMLSKVKLLEQNDFSWRRKVVVYLVKSMKSV